MKNKLHFFKHKSSYINNSEMTYFWTYVYIFFLSFWIPNHFPKYCKRFSGYLVYNVCICVRACVCVCVNMLMSYTSYFRTKKQKIVRMEIKKRLYS